jgi:hypothetical protein
MCAREQFDLHACVLLLRKDAAEDIMEEKDFNKRRTWDDFEALAFCSSYMPSPQHTRMPQLNQRW